MNAKEIKVRTPLCTKKGDLNEASIGWARYPLISCNVKGSYLRKKKWNYWCVTNDDFLFSATISHLDYAAVIFVYVLEFETKKFHEKTILAPLGVGCHMPDEVNATCEYKGKALSVKFEEKGDHTVIQVNCPNFSNKGEALEADITIWKGDSESLNVVVPWSKKRYQFTSKQPALPAKGTVTWKGKIFEFHEENAFGCLDFGRGKWPYRSTWNWGSASGIVNSKTIGLNFGGQWTDGTGQNENGLVIDGKLHKIHEDLVWTYNKDNYMDPWTIKTKDSNRVHVTFTPFFERVAATNALVIKSSVHQMIGTYKGTIQTDNGEVIEIDRLIGWAEDHAASW